MKKAGIWDDAYEGEKQQWFVRTIDLIRSRFHFTTDFATLGRAYFAEDYVIEEAPLRKNVLKHEGLKTWLPMLADRFESVTPFDLEAYGVDRPAQRSGDF